MIHNLHKSKLATTLFVNYLIFCMVFQQIKLRISVIHLFRVMLRGKYIFGSIMMIQGHVKGHKV